MLLDRNGKPRLFALPKRHPQHTQIVQVQRVRRQNIRAPSGGLCPGVKGILFFYKSMQKSFAKEDTVNFFFSKKKKLQKEVGELAARPQWQAAPFCSAEKTSATHADSTGSRGCLRGISATPLGDFFPIYGGKEFWIRFSTEPIQNPVIRGTGGFSYGANSKPFGKGNGVLSSTKVCKNPLARRIRLTFSFPKRKSYKKKLASMLLDRNGEPRLFALPKRHPQHTRKVRVQVGASEGFRQPLRGILSRFIEGEEI